MDKQQNSQWGTRAGFILAAVGSAVGLGNIWRFPYVAYENGGGAFFIPYLFALLTAGIPILIMEFTIGHKYRGSSPLSFFRLAGKKAEWIGWWGVIVAFVISTYYSVIIAWAIKYTGYAFTLKWGQDTKDFLYGDVLNLSEVPGEIGGFVPGVLIPHLFVWAIVFLILFGGVKKGIEFANRIFIPLLTVVFIAIVIRAVTLPGAMIGLQSFFQPDLSKLTNATVWVAAYGHIFFSLSIAFAIMITYSSYLPKKSDVTNNAFITGFANSSFELLAGIGVFAALGFMALQSGLPIDEVVRRWSKARVRQAWQRCCAILSVSRARRWGWCCRAAISIRCCWPPSSSAAWCAQGVWRASASARATCPACWPRSPPPWPVPVPISRKCTISVPSPCWPHRTLKSNLCCRPATSPMWSRC